MTRFFFDKSQILRIRAILGFLFSESLADTPRKTDNNLNSIS